MFPPPACTLCRAKDMSTLFTATYLVHNRPSKIGLKLNNWNTVEPPPIHPTSPQYTYNVGATLKTRKQGTSASAPLVCSHAITGPLHSGCNEHTSIKVLTTLHCN